MRPARRATRITITRRPEGRRFQRANSMKIEETNRSSLISHCNGASDEVTRVCSRQGFLFASSEFLRTTRNSSRQAMLLSVYVSHYDAIDEALGREATDVLVARVTDILRNALPLHAIIGRVSRDAFAALIGSAGPRAAMMARLNAAIDVEKAAWPGTDLLHLTGGYCHLDPRYPISICELWGNARHRARQQSMAQQLRHEMWNGLAANDLAAACGQIDTHTRH